MNSFVLRHFLVGVQALLLISFGVISRPSSALTGQEVYAVVKNSTVIVHLPSGLGSGVLVANDLVVTNCHVVKSHSEVTIEFFKVRVVGVVVGRNDQHDVCVVKLKGQLKGTKPIRGIRNWKSVVVGENMFALGAPTGFKYTFTSGIVSQKREQDGGQLIQFDAAISPGNSGGGLFDSEANLVGLPSFMSKEDINSNSLNFAWSVDVFPEPARSALRSLGHTSSAQAWKTAFANDQPSEALELANEWAKSAPNDPDAWVARGRSADKLRAGSGFGFFRNALELKHTHQDAMFYGAISARNAGDVHEFRRLLGSLRKINRQRAALLERTPTN